MGGNRRRSVLPLINLTNLNATDLLLYQGFVFQRNAGSPVDGHRGTLGGRKKLIALTEGLAIEPTA